MGSNRKYAIELSYNGANYHGWQIQPNANTVQQELTRAVSTITRTPITITGAGRTDTGVHAAYFTAHFESVADLDTRELCFRLNRLLPNDISLFSIKKVGDDFHARYSAISRTYKYLVTSGKSAFLHDLSHQYTGVLNLDKMNQAADFLTRYTDFTSFAKLHSDNKANICRVYSASWSEYREFLIFTIKADRFLRNMVRAITGTLLDIGKGSMEPGEMERILIAMDNNLASMSAPAKGLYLTDIEYPESYSLNNPVKNDELPFI